MIRSAMLSGLLLAAASLPVGLGPLAFVALVPLLRAVAGAAPRRAALAGWLGGTLFFGISHAFILTIGDEPGLTMPIAYSVYLVGLAGVLGLFAAVVSALHVRFGRGVALAAAPLLWVALELGRGLGPLGSPWMKLGYAVSDHPALIQLASLGGVHAVSLWVVGVNAALAGLRGAGAAGALGLAAVVAGPLAYAALALAPSDPDAPGLRVAAVQPQIANARKRVPEFFGQNLAALLRLSREAASEAPDVIVWPESSFERVVPPAGDPLLATIASSVDTPVLAGAWTVSPGDDELIHRNSALLATAQGGVDVVADKLHPIVMYERAPGSALSRALSRAGLWSGRFTPGEDVGLIELATRRGERVPVGVIVCIDSSYAHVSREMRRRGARALIEVSNEAGTGSWSARLHAQTARLRAVETAAPLVRVANTGPTAWMDARGRTVAALAESRAQARTVRVTLAGAPPPYVYLGEGAALAAGLLPPLAAAARRRLLARPPPRA